MNPSTLEPAANSLRTSEEGDGAMDDMKASLVALSNTVDRLLATVTDIRSLVGPFGVPMPDGSMLVQTIHGTKYLIDPNDRVMAPQLIVYRQWEPDLSLLFLRNLTPASVFVDVGANFGYFTCLAGSKIGTGDRGQVFAFEPNPRLLPLLRDNCAINWSMAPIQIHGCAVGLHRGTASLSIPSSRAANASLTSLSGDGESVEVDVVSLDEALRDGPQVDLLKIDVEGHEMAVLLGARQVIKRSPRLRIVMEWSAVQMQDAGTTADDAIGVIRELGLIPRAIPASGLFDDAPLMDLAELRATPYANIILTKAN
jgi:FkbM family methyltransferase